MESFISILKDGVDVFEDIDMKPETDFKSVPDWDSVSLLSIMAAISSEYGIIVHAELINSVTTVAELWDLVQAKK